MTRPIMAHEGRALLDAAQAAAPSDLDQRYRAAQAFEDLPSPEPEEGGLYDEAMPALKWPAIIAVALLLWLVLGVAASILLSLAWRFVP